jgi:hypothetical protein
MEIVALITAAASGLITAVLLIPVVAAVLSAHRTAKMINLVRTYVFAAEQIFGAGKGKEKFEYVKKALAKQGIKANESEELDIVRAQIEAAVKELKYLEQG